MTVLEGPAAIAAFDQRWDALVLAQPVPNPTLLSTWLQALAVDNPAQPLTILVRRGGRLVAGGAFALHEGLSPFGWKVATWLGSSLQLFSPDLIVDLAVPAGPELIADALLARVPAVYLVENPVLGLAAPAFATRAPWARAFPEQPGYRVALPSPRASRLERKSTYSIRRAERLGIEVNVTLAEAPARSRVRSRSLLRGSREPLSSGRQRGPPFANESAREWYRDTIGGLARESRAFLIEIQERGYLMASQLTLLAGRGALFHGGSGDTPGGTPPRSRARPHAPFAPARARQGSASHGARTVCRSAGRAERPRRALGNPLRPSRDRSLDSWAASARPCRCDAESRPHRSVTARPFRRMKRVHRPSAPPGDPTWCTYGCTASFRRERSALARPREDFRIARRRPRGRLPRTSPSTGIWRRGAPGEAPWRPRRAHARARRSASAAHSGRSIVKNDVPRSPRDEGSDALRRQGQYRQEIQSQEDVVGVSTTSNASSGRAPSVKPSFWTQTRHRHPDGSASPSSAWRETSRHTSSWTRGATSLATRPPPDPDLDSLRRRAD